MPLFSLFCTPIYCQQTSILGAMSSPTIQAVTAASSGRRAPPSLPTRFSPRRIIHPQRQSYHSLSQNNNNNINDNNNNPYLTQPVACGIRRSPRNTRVSHLLLPAHSSPDGNSIRDEDLLTPRSPTPSPTTRKLYAKEAKATAKARAAFNVIKVRNKIGQLSSARRKNTTRTKSLKNKRGRNKRMTSHDSDEDDDDDEHSKKIRAATASSKKSRQRKRLRRQIIEDDDEEYVEEEDNEEEDNEEGDFCSPQNTHVHDDEVHDQDFTDPIPMVNRHRQVFMERAFGDEKDGNCIAVRPQVELDHIVFVLEHWAVGQSVTSLIPNYENYVAVKKFRETHKEGYKYVEKYMVEYIHLPDGTRRAVLRRRENNRPNGGRIVVSREQVFDAIDEWHRSKGHMGMERTHTACREKYYNCTQLLVRIYVETCFVCMQKNPTVKALRGSRKPIRSNRYRERFQVDLIDFRKMRKRDPFGVLMRWIVTVKDHATGFTHVSAIPRKTARFVAHRLQEVFGLIGYPSIFHTDNGKEFTARAILRFLRRINPNIITVTGRPRKPSDQGSVERMNRLVKRVIASELAERRMAGENPNWTEVLGTTMAAINSQSGRCAYSASSFTSIFGQTYDEDISCSKEEARQCWTVAERLKVSFYEDVA